LVPSFSQKKSGLYQRLAVSLTKAHLNMIILLSLPTFSAWIKTKNNLFSIAEKYFSCLIIRDTLGFTMQLNFYELCPDAGSDFLIVIITEGF